MRGSNDWAEAPTAIWLVAVLVAALIAPAWLGWVAPTLAPMLLAVGLLRRAD